MAHNQTVLLFYTILFLMFSAVLSADSDVCSTHVQNLREEAQSALVRVQENFRDAEWNYLNYQETVYDPLWEAVVKRRDRFSGELKIEGEILYRRYRLTADQDLRRAENDMEAVFRELVTVKRGLAQEDSCGGSLKSEHPGENISQFNNCMSLWNHETGDFIYETEKILTHYQEKQAEFSAALELHLSDNPSEHDTFEDRYYHQFYEYHLKTKVIFLRLIRQIQERFELRWPAAECCGVCRADQRSRWDPVLSQVKLDPQGDSGVGGQLVNNARLKQAFERFEKEQARDGEGKETDQN